MRYLDDRQYAAMRAGAMTRRGLGARRVKAQLYVDGIAEQDSGEAIEAAEGAAATAAIGLRGGGGSGRLRCARSTIRSSASGRSRPFCARGTA